MCGGRRLTWGSQLALFLCRVGSRDWTQIVRLGDKCLYLLSHPACLSEFILQVFTIYCGVMATLLLLWEGITAKAMRKRSEACSQVQRVSLWPSRRETGRQADTAWAVPVSSHLLHKHQAGRMSLTGTDMNFWNLKANPSDSPPPTRPHPPILPKRVPPTRDQIQIYEPMGSILIQTPHVEYNF